MSLAALIERSQTDREAWRYTDLARWAALELKAATAGNEAIPAPSSTGLVFENGFFKRDLSTLDPAFACTEKEGELCLTLAAGAKANLTLHHFFPKASAEAETRLAFALGPNAELNLTEVFEAQAAPSALHLRTRFNLEKGAKLFHGKILRGADLHVADILADIEANAAYNAFALTLDGNLARNEWRVALKGDGATCAIEGLSLLRGKSQADNVTNVLHVSPNGSSRQSFKSVLAEKSRGVFQGKIVVEKDAQKTDGYQLSRALLLSDQAEMNAKPALEIFADDVKCSHGSTIGALDDEAMFYLQSRGISAPDAKRLLVLGFVGEMMEAIQDPAFRALAEKETEGWLHA